MAGTRKFDYVAVSNAFKNMTEITGDVSNPDSIAGILHNLDNIYREYVDRNDMAIYGDLGKQLLLDWDNTSSDFPSFVTNFENWANLIANAAGAYQQFEQDIANTKVNNPLGTSSAGLQQAYTSTGNYSRYDATAAINVHSFVGLNGIGYINTDMVSYEEQRKTSAIWSFGLNTFSTVLSVIGGAKIVGAEAAAGKTLSSTANSIAQNGLHGTLSSSSSAANAASNAVASNASSNVANSAAKGATNAAMQEADDAVAAAANNLENLMKPDSGATQAMIDMAKNEFDDALTLQANLRAQQTASGVANAAMQNADDAVTAAAKNLENLMKPDSGATQAMIDMAKNEFDDALTLQANLRAQQTASGVANAAMQEADEAVTVAAKNLDALLNPESGATQGMIDLAKNELDDALTLRANLSAQQVASGAVTGSVQQAATGAATGSAQTGSLLGAAQTPDMSLSGIANRGRDVINTVTTTGGLDKYVYSGYVISKGAEGANDKMQNEATQTAANGVMGSNASVTESVYSNR